MDEILDGFAPLMLYHWISILYKKYKLEDWNGKIPDPYTLGDKSRLGWDHELECYFHQDHEKFGKHIVECSNPWLKNAFVFFDYHMLKECFDSLDQKEPVPYVPTYYASPSDRLEVKLGTQLWKD